MIHIFKTLKYCNFRNPIFVDDNKALQLLENNCYGYVSPGPNSAGIWLKIFDDVNFYEHDLGVEAYLIKTIGQGQLDMSRCNNSDDCNEGHMKPICTNDLLSWAFQVARGMDYLSSRRVRPKKNWLHW